MSTLEEIIKQRKSQLAANTGNNKAKWKRRGEIEVEEALRKQKEWKEQQKINFEKSSLQEFKNKEQKLTSTTDDATTSNLDSTSDDSSKDIVLPPIQEVRAALRNYGEPSTLFGETDLQRFQRLRLLQLHKDLTTGQHKWQESQVTSVSTSRGFLFGTFKWDITYVEEEREREKERSAEEGIAESSSLKRESTDEDLFDSKKTKDRKKETKEKKEKEADNEMSEDENETFERLMNKSKMTDVPDSQISTQKDDSTSEEIPKAMDKFEFILFVLLKYLRLWDTTLQERPDHEANSVEGRAELAIFRQCDAYIKPLFKHLKKKNLARDTRDLIFGICQSLEKKDFIRANDLYLRMAIGNAPWPMGVTMSSIHDRSGQKKIAAESIAHILNDEEQRKYIQSVKRIITFASNKYNPAPSKTVAWR
ncbi:Pre-mRNA-splicing factor 18 [Monocercomonoides exilis]|uniref:Pre-mRNA-splicing factor 18 n=1 Tax=Monocercomonoides exilis TaxID=2049356 RepID=UPI00355A504D|nr:Pre-mRNA-splicing factor 18 [Monocercomonoides exilis]|eukprot:MONOS_562.1-p1 / transcript=MONOS_562.1 / gene=MONOS_562 / organism=Monocercomonoides_exilis_PA203 / gene_product=Pre-mRNA-splicing factor 18 / transcript_product=Pre-mRNA-splicing factor 18 / location=Mono_scaffold00009:48297-50048(+) / protein_length=421 / sequence_SO=supercontig / SO=protein_coding / is_pseudo=false